MNESYELPAEAQKAVEKFEKDLEDVEAVIVKQTYKLQQPIFEERDLALQKVDRFWLNALQNCMSAAVYMDDEDRDVLEFLTAVRVDRNLDDPREATLHFDFAENEYFTDKTLSRAYKLKKNAPGLGSEDFEFSEHVESPATAIHWTDEEHNLAKKNPLIFDEADESGEVQPGSLFASLFETKLESLSASVADIFINELYPRAINYYTGVGIEDYEDMLEDDEDDEDDEEDDDDEDDEEDEESDEDKTKEIDLEAEEDERPKKKTKN